MKFGETLTYLRKERGFNRKEFAEYLGIPSTTLRNYETSVREPGHIFLKQVSDIFNVSIDYLLGMTDDRTPIKKINEFSAEEKSLVKKYNSISDNGKKIITQTLNSVLDYESELKKIQTKKAELFELKLQSKELTVYDLPASAGTGQFLDSDAYQIIEFPVNEIPKNTTFGVRVSGNSMEPQFFDKDIAFVQRVHEVSSGSIGVFILNGDAYIKKMVCDQDECYLVSLNTSYDPIKIRIEDDLRIVGKVLWIS